MSDGNVDLFGEQILAHGETYQIRILNPVVSIQSHGIKALALIFGACAIAIVLGIVFLTNRFLTRFVFQHISDPLKALTEGVCQIQQGNLSYRIAHADRDEFLPVCEAFNDMAARLRTSVERTQKEQENRKELLAGISHDIRSPLTSIRAYVEGLLDGVADTPEKQRAYLGTIRAKTMELDQMVRKLFLFTKMDMGEYPYCPEALNASKEIADFLAVSEAEYRQRGLRIVVKPLPQDVLIEADPIYFRSILMNLLDNSAKYKHKEMGTAVISGKAVGENLVLLVEDDGPGVPEQALDKLFDVFYRNNPNQGSGLGLAIVAKSMERMKGAVRAENLPDGGLRIVLIIPRSGGEQEDETHLDD